MADYSYLPGLSTIYKLPSEKANILERADALSDFIVETRKALGVDGRVRISQMLDTYKRLSPSLHRLASAPPETGVDIDALVYCFKRLPKRIASIRTIYCSRRVDPRVAAASEDITASYRRRKCYRLNDSEVLMVCRDNFTDILDLVTLSCALVIEVQKICARFERYPSIVDQLGIVNDPKVKILGLQKLAFVLGTPFDKIFSLNKEVDDQLLNKLLQFIKSPITDLCIEIHPDITTSALDHRFHDWMVRIKECILEHQLAKRDIHIISSNLFSVVNVLSGFIKDHLHCPKLKEVCNSFLEDYEIELNKLDELGEVRDTLLYMAVEKWKNQDPSNKQIYSSYLMERGIYTIEDAADTGIDAQLIDTSKLSKANLDPRVTLPKDFPIGGDNAPIILNFHYPFGDQAGNVISVLCEHFQTRIRSIAIMGKAGTLVGSRGTVMVPSYFVMDAAMDVLEFENALTADQIASCSVNAIKHSTGPLLTVIGTVLQSNALLEYWKKVWGVIGLEMEGYSFLKRIIQYRLLGILRKDVLLSIAYYASDNPLAGETLAQDFGVAGDISLYAVSLAILNNIFSIQATEKSSVSIQVAPPSSPPNSPFISNLRDTLV